MWKNETKAGIKEREAAANEVLDDFRLHTRVHKQPMLNVLQHQIIAELEKKQAAHLVGRAKPTRTGQLLYMLNSNSYPLSKQRFATTAF